MVGVLSEWMDEVCGVLGFELVFMFQEFRFYLCRVEVCGVYLYPGLCF